MISASTWTRPAPADAFDRRLIVPMILGAILNPVNSSIVAVSLVPIGRAFGAPASQTAWLVSGLYLATAIGQPVVGRLVETYGPRRLFLAGTALVGIAGIIGTVASSIGMLVLARVILGVGTCAGYPAAMYLIRSEGQRTGRDSPAAVLTALAISTQTIAVIGPTLGGLLIGLGGWRLTLAVNIPLSAMGLVLGVLALPRFHAEVPVRLGESVRALDVPGMTLFAAMLTSLLLFLMSPSVDDLYLPVLTLLAAAAFGWRELRAAEPFIDLRILAGNRPLVATYGRMLLANVVSYAFLYGVAQWLQDGRGLSPSAAGLILLPVFGTGIVVSALTGRNPRIRAKLLVGSATQVVACALLLVFASGTPIWLLVVDGVLFGVPQGLNNLANQNALYRQADPDRIGSSAGLLRTFGYLGAIASSTAGGAFFGDTATTTGLHELAGFMVGAAALFLALSLFDGSLRDTTVLPGDDGPASPASPAGIRPTASTGSTS